MSGCIGINPSALLCPGSYYAVKAALYVAVAELIILEETYTALSFGKTMISSIACMPSKEHQKHRHEIMLLRC